MIQMKKSKNRGVLIVVSGPSGVGKGTICQELVKDDNIFYSVSATTRKPRSGELEGVNYFYKTHSEFNSMIDNNELLEWAEFCGNYYGTPKKAVEEKLAEGYDIILEIETDGAMQIKQAYPEEVFIFITPPSAEELERRIRGRQTEPDDVIIARLTKARREMKLIANYDYIVENDDISTAVEDIKAIIKVEKLKTKRNSEYCEEVYK